MLFRLDKVGYCTLGVLRVSSVHPSLLVWRLVRCSSLRVLLKVSHGVVQGSVWEFVAVPWDLVGLHCKCNIV